MVSSTVIHASEHVTIYQLPKWWWLWIKMPSLASTMYPIRGNHRCYLHYYDHRQEIRHSGSVGCIIRLLYIDENWMNYRIDHLVILFDLTVRVKVCGNICTCYAMDRSRGFGPLIEFKYTPHIVRQPLVNLFSLLHAAIFNHWNLC